MANPYDQTAVDLADLAARAGVDDAKKTIIDTSKSAAAPKGEPISGQQLAAPSAEKSGILGGSTEAGAGTRAEPSGNLSSKPDGYVGPSGVTGDKGMFIDIARAGGKALKYLSPVGAGYQGAPLEQFAPEYKGSLPDKLLSAQVDPEHVTNALTQRAKEVAKPETLTPKGGEPGVDPSTLQHPMTAPSGAPAAAGSGGGAGALAIPQEIWKLGPMAREAYARAFKAEMGAAAAENEAMQPELEVQKRYWQDFASKAAAREQGLAQAKIEDDQKKAAALKFYVDSQKDLAQAAKVDPDRWWASTSTIQKIGLVIAAGLTGYAAALHGSTDNPILRMMNQRIAEDIDAQKSEFQMKQHMAEGAKNAYAMAMNMIGDSRAAEATTWAAALDAAKAKVGEFEANTKSAMDKVKLQKTMAAIDMQIAQFLGQATQYGIPAHAGGGGAAGLSKHDEQEMKWLAEQLEKADYAPTVQLGADVMKAYQSGSAEGTGAFANYLYTKSPYLYEKHYGQEAAQREMLWNGFRNQAIKSLSGSGVTGTEMVRMQLQLDAANDPASRAAAAQNVMKVVQNRANQAIVAVNPRVADVYFGRLMGAGGGQAQPAPPLPPSSPVTPAK